MVEVGPSLRPRGLEPPDGGRPARTGASGQRATVSSIRPVEVVLLVSLVVASALVRLGGRGFSLWVDEGVSLGVATRPLLEIPSVLAQDGSPPLYYLLLHGWIQIFGASAGAVRALSLVFALVGVPVAFWAGRSLLSARAGWMAAVLVATVPYLSVHSREARMYSLLVLLGLVAVAAFLGAMVLGRRRWLPAFVLSLAAVLYTHHWGLFLALGLAGGALWCVAGASGSRRRRLALDATAAFGAVVVLYAPWVPSLLGQVGQTGAPWSRRPDPAGALAAVGSVLGGPWVVVVLAVVLVAALVVGGRSGDRVGSDDAGVAGVLALVGVTTLVTSWLSSQVAPAWSARYFGTYLPVMVLLGALGLARSGRLGVAGLGLLVVLWTVPLPFVADGRTPAAPVPKSNVETLAAGLTEVLRPGDVVLSTQIEQVPLLAHYLGTGLRYADPTGTVADPTVADWRHALERMRTADPVAVLDPLVAGLEAGGHVVVACPRLFTDEDDLLWYRLMDRHCASATRALEADRRVVRTQGPVPGPDVRQVGASVAVTVYERVGG